MTVLAALDLAGIAASARELERGGTSYAIETLRETRSAHPGSRIFFVLGTDQFAEIASWREPQAIVTEFELIVAGRPGSAFDEALAALPPFVHQAHREGRIVPAPIDPVDLSSTVIRAKVRAGEPIAGLVTPRVGQYIEKYGLYRPGG
jgi:nicotinate-nucleotide adenylyltransferase